MKKIISTLILFLTVAVSAAAAQRIAIFSVSPEMTCENCENKIKTNLRHTPGIKQINTSLRGQTITIRYEADKTSPEAIIKAFEKIGYKATQVTSTTSTRKSADGALTEAPERVVGKPEGKAAKAAAKANAATSTSATSANAVAAPACGKDCGKNCSKNGGEIKAVKADSVKVVKANKANVKANAKATKATVVPRAN